MGFSITAFMEAASWYYLIIIHAVTLKCSLCGSSAGKGFACRRPGFVPWVRKIPWRREWQPTPVFLPGESHGQRSLVSYSPRGRRESDTTERLPFPLEHLMLSTGWLTGAIFQKTDSSHGRKQTVAAVEKNPPAQAGDLRDRFAPWAGETPWRRAWQPTPIFLPGESHGQRSLAG